ncbi:hypothetical protein FUT79_13520 [Treponema phagedenis]|uniref:hypothetical protein n=2 Tax=Treponema TaxID=157 RepID=UPI0011E69EA0|nr:hypothetical protein [Treponema phagedenis]QEJ96120.1 hypothetical protein FUT79_13520 [Treponema phagedenis]TYT76423.1 hypothetical protein FS559_15570 [Treponema phagedenis]TYT76563.1 hypothetical protein FS559_13970 [Treponema phagedenis]TYT76841.1 hypothetical protein FS559_13105 [Treponema phagedenis]TYT77698.1 hypothetical protein FS559_00425 [Treponema phagedenis]
MKMNLTKKIDDLIAANDESGLDAIIKEHGGYIFKTEYLGFTSNHGLMGEYFYSNSFEEAVGKTKEYLSIPLQKKEDGLSISLELITKFLNGGLEYGANIFSKKQTGKGITSTCNLSDCSNFEQIKRGTETLSDDDLLRFKKLIEETLM